MKRNQVSENFKINALVVVCMVLVLSVLAWLASYTVSLNKGSVNQVAKKTVARNRVADKAEPRPLETSKAATLLTEVRASDPIEDKLKQKGFDSKIGSSLDVSRIEK